MHLTANSLGQFSGWLSPEKAGGPYSLTVTGAQPTSTATAEDLLVGDVWFASGQSNMEMPLKGFGAGTVVKNGEQEIAGVSPPQHPPAAPGAPGQRLPAQ